MDSEGQLTTKVFNFTRLDVFPELASYWNADVLDAYPTFQAQVRKAQESGFPYEIESYQGELLEYVKKYTKGFEEDL